MQHHTLSTNSLPHQYISQQHSLRQTQQLTNPQLNNLKEYELPYSEYMKQKEIYIWRQRTHHPILKVTTIKQILQRKTVLVTCQQLTYGLDEIREMKLQEIIYCMSQMLLGYQQILLRLGYACVQQHLVGLNNKGEIRLWVNGNSVTNTPGSNIILRSQHQILNKIVMILQQKCVSSDNKIFFTGLKSITKTIVCYLDYLMRFKVNNKLKIVPKINVVNNNKSKSNITLVNIITNNNSSSQSINTPMLTSTSTNFIPTIPQHNHQYNPQQQSSSSSIIENKHNSQSQSQFATINKHQSQHQLLKNNHNAYRGQQQQQLESCKSVKTTSIIYPQNHQFIINNNNNNNDQNTLNSLIQPQINNNNVNTQNINTNQQSVKSSSKINFSYSQKRNDFSFTPRQSNLLRDYTSDRRLPLLTKIQSQNNNQIKQFTLMDDQRQANKNIPKSLNNIAIMSRSTNNIRRMMSYNRRRIVPSYTISYNPMSKSLMLQNELELKKSRLSQISQMTLKQSQQQQQEVLSNVNKSQLLSSQQGQRCQNNNKTSMTTNHRSGVSQSYQSLGKSSNINVFNNNINGNGQNNINNNNDNVDRFGRRNNINMFASNSSHRVSYSMVKDSMVENDGVKNTKSILINTSQQLGMMNNSQHIGNTPYGNNNNHQHNISNNLLTSPKNTIITSLFGKQQQPSHKNTSIQNINSQQHNYNQNNNKKNTQNNNQNNTQKDMYTFGGLIVQNNNNTNLQPISKTNNNNTNKLLEQQLNNNNNKANQLSQPQQYPINQHPKETIKYNKLTLNNKINNNNNFTTTPIKSIQQLYKTINFKSQKKSIMLHQQMDNHLNNKYQHNDEQQQNQQNYSIHLSPVACQQQVQTPIKQSHIITGDFFNKHKNNNNRILNLNLSPVSNTNLLSLNLSPNNNKYNHNHHHLQQPHYKYQHTQPQQQQQQFDYNQWRGITGLLNQSNIYQLKQSIHCGPQIRTPLNIKLQLLDKFGRQIGHSILPNTPNGLMSPNNHHNMYNGGNSCVRSICIDQQ